MYDVIYEFNTYLYHMIFYTYIYYRYGKERLKTIDIRMLWT